MQLGPSCQCTAPVAFPSLQAQASFSQHYPDLAAQHMKQLSAKVNAHSNGTASSNTCPHDAQSIRKQLQSMEVLLAACGSAAASGSEAADGRGLLSPGRMGNEAAAATYPDGVGGAQSLLAQASTASKSLQAAEQVCWVLMASVLAHDCMQPGCSNLDKKGVHHAACVLHTRLPTERAKFASVPMAAEVRRP